jgi:chromosome segregation ATPase
VRDLLVDNRDRLTSELRELFEQRDAELARLTTVNSQLENDKRTLKSEREQLTSTNRRLIDCNTELKQKYDQLRRENAISCSNLGKQPRKNLSALKLSLARLKSDITTLLSLFPRFTDFVTPAFKQKTYDLVGEEMQRKQAIFETKYSKLKHKRDVRVQENVGRREQQQSEISLLENESTQLKSAHETKEKIIQQQRELVRQLTQDNQILKGEYHNSSEMAEKLCSDLATTQQQLLIAQTRADKAQLYETRFARLKSRYRKELIELESDRERLTTLLSASTHELEDLKSVILMKENKLVEYSQKLTEFTALISEAEQMKSDFRTEITTLKADNRQLDLLNNELCGRVAISKELNAAICEKQKLSDHSNAFSASLYRLKKQTEITDTKEREVWQEIRDLKEKIDEKMAAVGVLEAKLRGAEGDRVELRKGSEPLTPALDNRRCFNPNAPSRAS